jgi:hypothetical protein
VLTDEEVAVAILSNLAGIIASPRRQRRSQQPRDD